VVSIVEWARASLRLDNISLMLVLMGGGAFLLFVRPRWGRRWIVAVVVGYWFVSTPFGSGLLVAPLVRGYGSIENPVQAGSTGAIVVLGGGIRDVKVRSESVALPHEFTVLRVLEAVRVFRLLEGRALVVASGGFTSAGRRTSEAAVIADTLVELGVPAERIVLEDQSSRTREQAVNVTRLLKSRGVPSFVLVTSPTHMSRAAAAFRAEGADVVPSVAALAPADLPNRGYFVPNEESLQLSDQALYAYAGIVYYWARGWFSPAAAGGNP
jgi:uncharacterized SAM-binding protein YcdF (DUF218 family)